MVEEEKIVNEAKQRAMANLLKIKKRKYQDAGDDELYDGFNATRGCKEANQKRAKIKGGTIKEVWRRIWAPLLVFLVPFESVFALYALGSLRRGDMAGFGFAMTGFVWMAVLSIAALISECRKNKQ